jgi:cystathionine beta-lyase
VNKVTTRSIEELKGRQSAKWRMFPGDVTPLALAEMDFDLAEPIKATLGKMIDRSDLGYGGIAPELGAAFAGFAKRRWGWDPDPAQCWLVTDVAIAGVETMRQFCEPGDAIGFSTPVYHDFVHWISQVNAQAVDVPLLHHGAGVWSLDLNRIESAFADGMKAYILCNPHNPVGYVPKRAELEQLADLADEHDVVIISDEIHAPLIYTPHVFTPYLSINAQARRTGVVITSASKAWNTAGLKCAQIITQDVQRSESFKHFPEHTSWHASILGAWANITAYNECEFWLNDVLVQLDKNRKLVAELLAEHLPLAQYSIPECTYLAWIDLSAYHSELPAAYIREHAKVAFSEGIDFGPAGAGHVRLNFATSPEIISDAIKRAAEVLGQQ